MRGPLNLGGLVRFWPLSTIRSSQCPIKKPKPTENPMGIVLLNPSYAATGGVSAPRKRQKSR